MERRADIEGLRALAVALVLLYHAGVDFLPGGYVGVDVFFVISGYLITSLMLAERAATGRLSLVGFYSRRIRRILPVASLVALATLVASSVWLEPLRLRGLATDVLASAGFSSNLVLAGRGADYLQSTLPPSPLQHYWSLAVEEQFYVVWPVLVALAGWGIGTGRGVLARARVGILAAAVTGASFAACMSMMGASQVDAFYRPQARAFELAAGALAAVLPSARRRGLVAVEAAAGWAGLLAVVGAAMTYGDTTAFPGPAAALPVVATVLVIRGASRTRWSAVAVLGVRPAQWLGSRSFSAYLWHWPLGIIAAAALGRDLRLAESLGSLGAALVLSEVSYRFVENPVRRRASLVGGKAFALGLSMLLVVAGSGLLVRANPPRLAAGPDAATPVLGTAPPSSGAGTTSVPGASTTTMPAVPVLPGPSSPIPPVAEAVTASRVPSNLTPSLSGALGDMPSIYHDDCHAAFGVTEPKDCVFGDASSGVVVGLYGDSHAAEWFPAFEKVAIKNRWRLVTYTKRGCPPAEVEVYSKVLGKVYVECRAWRRNVLAKMAADGVSVVFVAVFERLLDARTRIPVWQKPWRDALRSTFADLRGGGMTPVLVEDTPYPGRDVPTCLSDNLSSVSGCTVSVGAAFREDLAEMRDDLSREGVAVLRTRQWFCTPAQCPVVVGNILVYRDDNHITVAYARLVAPLLDDAVVPFVEWHARRVDVTQDSLTQSSETKAEP